MEQEVQAVETTAEVETPATENKEEVKTFTQEEVDEMIKTRLRKMPSKEELKEFNEWKESQKTEAEKSIEKDNKIASLEAELVREKNINVVANADVDPRYQKFVLAEVSQIEGEFKENLEEYLKNNPQYVPPKPTTTGLAQSGTNKQISEEQAYLDKKYANNPFYKKS